MTYLLSERDAKTIHPFVYADFISSTKWKAGVKSDSHKRVILIIIIIMIIFYSLFRGTNRIDRCR